MQMKYYFHFLSFFFFFLVWEFLIQSFSFNSYWKVIDDVWIGSWKLDHIVLLDSFFVKRQNNTKAFISLHHQWDFSDLYVASVLYSFSTYTGGSSARQDGQRLAGLSAERSVHRTMFRQVELFIIWPQRCDIILV